MAESGDRGVVTKERFKIRSEEPPNAQDAASPSEVLRLDASSRVPVAAVEATTPIEEEKLLLRQVAMRDRKPYGQELAHLRSRSPVHARLISISPVRADKAIETSDIPTVPARPKPMESPQLSDDSEQLVPLQVFESFATVVSAKFSEMLTLHRDIMLEIIHKDANRDEQVMLLLRENAKLAKQVTEVEVENQLKREKLGKS